MPEARRLSNGGIIVVARWLGYIALEVGTAAEEES
jgi:hypothetical protein